MATVEQQKQIVTQLRDAIVSRPYVPLGALQRATSQDKPAKGNIWIGRTTFPAPSEPDLRSALYDVIERLKTRSQEGARLPQATAADVGVEFIGKRAGVRPDEPEPASMPEVDKVRHLEKEWDKDTTILFLHGGAFIFSSAPEFRAMTVRLAKMTSARVAALKYRLAPVNPWPSAILDGLIAYASLLYPPEGACWTAAKPGKIVLVGDSSGGNLALALTNILLELQKQQDGLRFNRHCGVKLPLPAGAISSSGWFDMSDVFPSNFDANRDIIPSFPMSLLPEYPADDIWPSKPPREHTYCGKSLLDHPLVSIAAVADWTGAPPLLIACGGEERLVDCNRVLAAQAARCGVRVAYHEYEGMPHDWCLFLSKLPQARHYFDLCARTSRQLATECLFGRSATRWLMPVCEAEDLGDIEKLFEYDHDEMRQQMAEVNKKRKLYVGKKSRI